MIRLRRILLLCSTIVLLPTIHAFGATVEVGNCSNFPQYGTIQSAVNGASPGDTVLVCPGNYPEQIKIGVSITLQGIMSIATGGESAVVTVPPHGLVPIAVSLRSGLPIAPQIFVEFGANVTINNLVVNGQNNGITGCGPDLVGILFQNASGTVTHSAIINEVLSAGLTGCQSGLGIYVQSSGSSTSNVNVNNTFVENYQKNGITGNEVGTTLTATGNTVVGQGSTTGAAENGIQIGFGATGTVTANTVTDDVWGPDTSSDPGDAAAGILVYASPGVSISSNQVTDTQFGIAIVSDPAIGAADGSIITSNTVNATHIFDAIDVCSNSNTVKLNTINGATESGIHLDDTCGTSGSNNTVKNNTVSLSCAGILEGAGTSGNLFTGGTYYSVVQNLLSGSDTCTAGSFAVPAALVRAPTSKHYVRKLSPARL